VVAGRVTVAGSDRGVPDLIVEAHDVRGDERIERLGSGLTNSQGAFTIEVPPREQGLIAWLLDGRPRRNLRVAVLAPERDDVDPGRRLLFTSEVRDGAGEREEFRIAVAAASLEAAGVPVPASGTVSGEAVADAIEAMQQKSELIQAATDAVVEGRLDAVTERRTVFRDDVAPRLVAELSTVSDAERASGRFVDADDAIEPTVRAAVTADVTSLIAKEPDPVTGAQVGKIRFRGRVLLSDAEMDAVLGDTGQPQTLSEEDLEQRLGVRLDKPPAVYRRHIEPDPCRPRGEVECCLDDNGGEGEDGDEDDDGGVDLVERPAPAEDENGDRAGAGVVFDKQRAIARLLGRQQAPEDPVEFGEDGGGLEGPLTAGGVADVINGLTLVPGPADVPAFYDFHDLQVAFEPVWREALDDKFFEDVERAYDDIVERGGAPAVSRVGAFLAGNPVRFLDGFLDSIFDIGSATDLEVPPAVAAAVYISPEEWRALTPNARVHLAGLATGIEDLRDQVLEALNPENMPTVDLFNIGEMIRAANTKESIALRGQIQLLTADAERIVAHARRTLLDREASEAFRPTHEIIEKLRHARGQGYPFRYFAASPTYRSVNFGVMVTYRQLWTPISYQVGELVSTIPLAPKEIRRFSKRTVIKTKRARQEIESNLVSRRAESEEKTRAEAEIVARATAKTNFSLSNSGTMNIGDEGLGGSVTSTSTFTRDAERHSESVKKEFREAILKSAEEYKNERKVEVSTEETFESEVTESGEIQNPNDEIPVTFLFYELQRRFQVNEKLHRLQSVVLVAQEVPSAGAIDSAWLIKHDWILNRVLLDDSHRAALGYASTSLISDEIVLRESRQALFRQRKLVEELKEDVEERRALAGLRYAALQRQIERTAKSADSGGGLFGGLGDLVGGVPVVGDVIQGGLDLLTGGGDGPSEAAQLREGAARDAFDRERREEEELASRLQNAMSVLEAMQREYSQRLGEHLRELTQVERLISHIVQNILLYMQAIWAYEPDDQRYLRLRNVPVPVFEKDKALRTYTVQPEPMALALDRTVGPARTFEVAADLGVFNPPARPQDIETKPLSEIADIDRPLGFLGNYMIFPMTESNPITEFMMDPYVTVAEGEYGVSDPDPLGNMTLDEFCEYVCCLRDHFEEQGEGENGGGEGENGEGEGENGDGEAVTFDDLKPFLRATLKELLQRSLRDDEEVVVGSDSLYIEALPGAHSVMERFKHLHRQIDVKAAQESLRRVGIDNIRRAERILDADLEDPEIEAKYVFEGDGSATVVAPGGPGAGGDGGGGGPCPRAADARRRAWATVRSTGFP
jgi:hypothetical protein